LDTPKQIIIWYYQNMSVLGLILRLRLASYHKNTSMP